MTDKVTPLTAEQASRIIKTMFYPGCEEDFLEDSLQAIASGAHRVYDASEKVAVDIDVLKAIEDHFDTDCRLDHEGYCQEHLLEKPCSIAQLKSALSEKP